jgi:phage terminase large subunit
LKRICEKRIQIADGFSFLFENKARYRAAYGGRGSGKSHSFASALVLIGATRPIRVLCCREIQKSIADSVKKLLDDCISAFGLGPVYRSTQTSITTPAGTEFIFAGLRTNADSIKSMEGIDIAWVEEANTVSQRSMDLLIPTVRKPGSELWFTWNPRDAKDPVDAMFRGGEPPPNSIVRKVNFTDNPWFPDVLREDMEWDKRRDPDKYAHVWLGEYRRNSEARVFKNWRIGVLEVPEDARPYYGADWGFATDPSVLVRSYLLDERTLYIDREAYAVGCEIDHTPALFAGDDTATPPRWANPKRWSGVPGAAKWPITADSARPETISYMAKRGFRITGARKGPGSVEEGVAFLQSCDIVVHPDCKHVIDELTLYSHKVDKLTNEVLPVLEDKKNHCIDAIRYSHEGSRTVFKGQAMFELARQRAERQPTRQLEKII